MAVTLVGSGNDRVDWGDLADSSFTAMSWAFTITPSGAPATHRIWSHWGSSVGNQAWLLTTEDNDELGLTVSTGSSVYWQTKTSGLNLADATLYRCCWTITLGSPPTATLHVNGASQSLVAGFASGNVTSIPNSGTAIQLGHESDETEDGLDAHYAEVAMWSRALAASEAVGLTKGWSPRFYRRNGFIYASLLTTAASHTRDIWNGVAGALTGGATVAHPNVNLPQPPLYSAGSGASTYEMELTLPAVADMTAENDMELAGSVTLPGTVALVASSVEARVLDLRLLDINPTLDVTRIDISL